MEAAIEVDSSCCSLSIAKGFLDIFVETTGIAIIAIAVVLDIRELVAAAVTAGMLVALRDLLRLRSQQGLASKGKKGCCCYYYFEGTFSCYAF